MTSAPATYSVGDYLMDRLAELGVGHVFGVPGDYSLGLLDHVTHHPTVEWVGCCNELNAGYAADGYGRLRGMAALCTTFGVGELSAVNALAGSFAEFVPVVHIVGAPARGAQAAHRIVHHTLGDGVFDHFLGMHVDITCAQAVLSPDNAAAEIDRVLATVRDTHRPGYLLIPSDVASIPVEAPVGPLSAPATVTSPEVASAFVDAAAGLLDRAGSAAGITVLAGVLVHRLNAVGQLSDLLATGPLRHATTLWAKSLVDENGSEFAGTYAGAVSDEQTRTAVEDAEALIVAGVEFTDLNSGLFSQRIDRSRTIEIGADTASVADAVFAPLALPDALAALLPLIVSIADRRVPAAVPEPTSDAGPATTVLRLPAAEVEAPAAEEALTQHALWAEITGFLRSGDIVLADQGTSFYGMGLQRLPAGVTFLGQPLWAAIGYTLPALLGACLAQPSRRGVLLIGDGAAQMTIQELGTVLRRGITPVVVIVDNSGYTVERAIHGPNEQYNDIATWDWTAAARLLAPGVPVDSRRVETVAALRAALSEAAAHPRSPIVIQAVVPAQDIPPLLAALTRALAVTNAGPPDHG